MPTFGRSAMLVVAAALLPLLLFAAFGSGFSAREQRRTIEARALGMTETMIASADGEVKRHVAALDALATATALSRDDFTGFAERAREIAGMNRDWVDVQLIDRNGRSKIDIAPAARALQINQRPASGQSTFAGYARGAGCPCLVFDRIARDASADIIRLLVSTRTLQSLQPPARGRYEVSAFAGPDGRFITRTIDDAGYFGRPGSRYLQAAVAGGKPDGIYHGYTLEGFENYTAFTRSNLTGWTAHVALGSEYIDSPARRFIASFGTAAALSVLLAAVLILFVLRQISQARAMAMRMEQSQKLEALGQLTGGIAHDFNNLLTPIVGALDFLVRKSELDERSKRIVEGALSSAQRAGKLTGQLLAFSRRQRMMLRPVDIGEAIEAMRPLLEQSVGSDHRVRIDAPAEPLCGETDLNQLELAILNLVINARDAMPRGGPIDISLEAAPPRSVRISVADQGEGMTEDVRRRALEPFFTTKRQGAGTGLGLAQVFGVVQQSGGTLDIASAPGDGTTISILLPRCDPPPVAPAEDGELILADRRKLRILVVDDDQDVRAAITRPLEEVGHMVDSVGDGATGLAAIEQRAFDAVLVDYQMPQMNGAEFIRRARALRPALDNFLIVTGFADSDQIAAAAAGTPILKKPFDGAELLAAIRRLTNP